MWAGEQYGWRYLARRVSGTGTPGPWLDNELPLLDVGITEVLSGPDQLTARIEPQHARLVMADGMPLLSEYDTEIYAEVDGNLAYGGFLVRSEGTGPTLDVEASGFSGYAKGMGYSGDQSFVETDPLDIVRHIWAHIQASPASNIALWVDQSTKTPVRIGKNPPAPAADGTTPAPTTSQDEEPYRLATWMTEDLGDEIDELASTTPFDYREVHTWNHDKTNVEHRLEFGYPRLGRRLPLAFVVGENVTVIPSVSRDGSTWCNHVRVLGAGEGSAMVRADAYIADGRLRRMVTITDDAILDYNQARARARRELAMRHTLGNVSDITVRNTGETALGAWHVGDEIRLQSDTGWLRQDHWYRVISRSLSPESPEIATATLIRADRFAS